MKVWAMGFVLFLGLGLTGCGGGIAGRRMVAAAKNLDQQFVTSSSTRRISTT